MPTLSVRLGLGRPASRARRRRAAAGPRGPPRAPVSAPAALRFLRWVPLPLPAVSGAYRAVQRATPAAGATAAGVRVGATPPRKGTDHHVHGERFTLP